MKYRNIFKFPPRWFFRWFRRILGGVGVSVIVVVLALSDRGPLEKEEMGTVITVRGMSVVVGIRGSRRG